MYAISGTLRWKIVNLLKLHVCNVELAFKVSEYLWERCFAFIEQAWCSLAFYLDILVASNFGHSYDRNKHTTNSWFVTTTTETDGTTCVTVSVQLMVLQDGYAPVVTPELNSYLILWVKAHSTCK